MVTIALRSPIVTCSLIPQTIPRLSRSRTSTISAVRAAEARACQTPSRSPALHRTEIGFVESGRRLPRVDTLIKLASALGVDPGELLEGVEWVVPAPTRAGSFVVSPQTRGGHSA
jgi:Helix-turn-helix